MHITWRELRAVRLLAEHYADVLRHRRVLLWEDNTGVVSIITNMVSRSPELMHELRKLLDVLEMLDCELSVHYTSAATARLPRYWTLQPEPGADATDAFAQRWEGEIVWAHPQPWLIPRVEQYLREHEAARALVCVPTWPHEAWYSQLRALADEELSLPPGVLQRVAFDAPQRLESWAMTIFVVLRGTAVPRLGTRCT